MAQAPSDLSEQYVDDDNEEEDDDDVQADSWNKKDKVITLQLLQPSGRSTSCRVSLQDRISDVKMRVKDMLFKSSGYVRLIRDGEELLDIKSTVKDNGLSDGQTITVIFNQSYTYASFRAGERPPWESDWDSKPTYSHAPSPEPLRSILGLSPNLGRLPPNEQQAMLELLHRRQTGSRFR
ncbi:unnamed protein product [Symbiodinium sp. CCMP2592]|nr:unnamed protein product [Symbiodinium sp. CCMP2592]